MTRDLEQELTRQLHGVADAVGSPSVPTRPLVEAGRRLRVRRRVARGAVGVVAAVLLVVIGLSVALVTGHGRADGPSPTGPVTPTPVPAVCHVSQDGSSYACDDVFYLYPNGQAVFRPLANDRVPEGGTASYCGNTHAGRTQVVYRDQMPIDVALSRYAKPGTTVTMTEYVTDHGDCSDNYAVAHAGIVIHVLQPIKPTITLGPHGEVAVTNPNQVAIGCQLFHTRSTDADINGHYDAPIALTIAAHTTGMVRSLRDAGHVRRLQCDLDLDLINRLVHLKR